MIFSNRFSSRLVNEGSTCYDVLKFIEHGGRCRPAMDYVQGELLIYRLKHSREIEKTLLFEWMRELLHLNDWFYKMIPHGPLLHIPQDKFIAFRLQIQQQKPSVRRHQHTVRIHITVTLELTVNIVERSGCTNCKPL